MGLHWMENLIELILPTIISVLELFGIFVVTVSALKEFGWYLVNLFDRTRKKHNIKFELANSMATGLEFKMAAEILKTVLVRDFNELLILGAIILLRALLSLLIHFEMRSSSVEENLENPNG